MPSTSPRACPARPSPGVDRLNGEALLPLAGLSFLVLLFIALGALL